MALNSLFWMYDNSGVKQCKILGINKTNRKYYLLGDLISVAPRKYKLNKKHLKKKRTIFSAVIVGIRRWTRRPQALYIKFKYNKTFLLSRVLKFLGTRVYGLIVHELGRVIDKALFRKFYLLAYNII